ncbi:MAG TPA: sialidase family protein [Thermoanaerobaculales bacterium]|nr:sialidase family protein [Thermoanaerobaculales bacterium]HPA79179.1 sialidase family protein [Thermoanaerobaculales bacterium]HQL29152.1 sialidase family protein [Thermoanaerobaculales bacterium]HQN95074.1 sialidase family protein [Thermoanaerobaculales bacterium]HQP42217.1 sialidase family protein [Thermoanaerobaculales bacterium]
MSRLTLGVVLLALAVGSTIAAAAGQPAAAPRILVGPNMLVSRDGDFPHVELILAANPKNAKNLLGGAITYTRPNGGTACRAYATVDGGTTWRPSEFAEQVRWGGADPYVAFTPHGTGIFSALAFAEDETGRGRAFLHVWRSSDGGLTWGPTIDLGCSYDHEQITVDQTTGRFAGRIYIGTLYGYPEYTVGVFRSEDDGQTWIGPVAAASGGGTKGINVIQPMVLSDGTLVVPYADFEFLPDKVKYEGMTSSTAWLVLSEDGGVSFGAPRKIQTMQYNVDDKDGRRLSVFPAFAADSRSQQYRDRIYVAWTDFRSGPVRVLFSRSEDRGLHWSEPILVDPAVPAGAMQGQPVVAVNPDGVVGVTWYDTRDATDGFQFHQYFAASVDGGSTFLPPVRVSSAISSPLGPGNMNLGPTVFEHNGTSLLSLVSAASRWPGGGDYMGMAADRNGVFHPFWADARTGTFQIYTAAVSVVLPAKDPDGASAPAASPELVKAVVDDRVEVVFDPTRFDGAAKVVEIPARLQNISGKPIHPPITLTVTGFGFKDPELPEYPYPPMWVIDPVTGAAGETASFDFSGALGNLESLVPGALSGPVVVKFRFEDPTLPQPIRFKVEGMVEP